MSPGLPPRSKTRNAFTLIELLVVIAIIALLVSILLPSLAEAREQAKQVKCAAHLAGIGRGVQVCFTEYKGYGPSWDDGEPGGPIGHMEFMLTWADVLFDHKMVGDPRAQLCPSDQRPDWLAKRCGAEWGFSFVDNIGVGETPKRGVRTSFAINAIMHHNYQQDRFPDASRQVFAIDGYWTWFPNLNAVWLFYSAIYGREPAAIPNAFPTTGGSFIAWRHGPKFKANTLYLDGHAAALTPRRPKNPTEWQRNTVDTVKSFCFLPGERNTWDGFSGAPYSGDLAAYNGRRPVWTTGAGTRLRGPHLHPHNYPFVELDPCERTLARAWRNFASTSQGRR
ncbi:MAG: type II secretion system protein [Planctomycetota bacterium]